MGCRYVNRDAGLVALLVILLGLGVFFGLRGVEGSAAPDTFVLAAQGRQNEVEGVEERAVEAPLAAVPEVETLMRIGRKTVKVFSVNTLAVNPGARVAFYEGQFLFGHSSGVFSELGGVESFQIVRGVVVEEYRIVKKVVYCDYSNARQHGARYDCARYSEPKLPTRAFGNRANYYEARAEGYDLVLMTCAGEMLPGQDATHRLLAYAVRVR